MPASDDRRAPDDPNIRPLGRGATRLLVVAAVLLAFAAAIGGSLYLLDTAKNAGPPVESLQPPADSTYGTPADSSGAGI